MPDEASNTTSVVVGGGVGGAVATILTWVLKQFFQIDLPPEVASAIAFLLSAGGGWIGGKI